jgi:lipoate-protein ligase A
LTRPWRVEVVQDSAGTIHSASAALIAPGVGVERCVRVLHALDRAVVLGSTQPAEDVDAARAAGAGVSVVRRDSGGGAVLVGPGLVVWVDVAIPASDPLWEADVGRAFWWLGATWVAALAGAGFAGGGQVWHGGMRPTRWSAKVCFAGLGSGEVTAGAAKVVGMAQRRTRAGTLFQCAVPVVWDPVPLLDVLAMSDDDRAAAEPELAGCAVGVGVEVAGRLVPAFMDRLP